MIDGENAPLVPNDEQVRNIPEEMRTVRQWITWTWGEVRSNGKPTKPPTDPKTGVKCDPTNADIWTTFDEAYAAAKRRGQGIGFVCLNGWCGVDLDNCVDDRGALTPEAQEIVGRLISYTEFSPSRRGLHIVVKATLADDVNTKKPFGFEMYSASGHYLTVTGDVLEGMPLEIRERQDIAEQLYAEFKPKTVEAGERADRRRMRAAIVLDDESIREKIMASADREKFERLWDGDTSAPGGDHSAADLALCGTLAFWLDCDSARMDAWFRRSGVMRDKWDERHGKQTYGALTISKAIAGRENTYRYLGFEIRDDSAVYHVEVKGEGEKQKVRETFVCSLIEILGEARDVNNAGWSLLIKIRDRDGVVSEHLMQRTLAEDTRELFTFLVDRGVVLNSSAGRNRARRLLVQYLSAGTAAKRARLVKTTGWHGDVFVIPGSSFGQSSESFMFDGDRVKHPYQVAGTLDGWLGNVSRLCVGNSRLTFAVSAGFAGPLLPFVTDASIGFHLFGLTSMGKTTTLSVAASGCGPGRSNGYVETWRATANGLERVAALHNHSLLCLDELKELDPRQTGEVLYLLGNGSGKRRMRRDTSLAETLAWQIVTLSTGEPSIEDYAREAGKRLRGGQRVRMVDIPADGGRGYGVFEDLHGESSPAAFARRIANAARENYGNALRGFLEKLTADRDTLAEQYRDKVRVVTARFAKSADRGDSGEVHRVAGHFALVAAAGEIATGMGITGWSVGDAEGATETCFHAWFERRGTAGSSDQNAMVSFVRLLIERDGASRFQPISEDRDGATVERIVVINRLGYKWRERGQLIFFFLPEAFAHECSGEGFEVEQVARALDALGMLRKAARRLQYRRRTPDGAYPWGYAVSVADGDDEDAQMRLPRAA
jgi:uncharacterized protein (DUF927 family)